MLFRRCEWRHFVVEPDLSDEKFGGRRQYGQAFKLRHKSWYLRWSKYSPFCLFLWTWHSSYFCDICLRCMFMLCPVWAEQSVHANTNRPQYCDGLCDFIDKWGPTTFTFTRNQRQSWCDFTFTPNPRQVQHPEPSKKVYGHGQNYIITIISGMERLE